MRVDWTIERTLALDDLKRRLNLPLNYVHHDAKLLELLGAATEQFESDTDRVCMEQTFTMYLPRFEQQCIELFKRPVTSIVSIKYMDPDGVEQTLDPAAYKLSTARRRVQLLSSPPWPDVKAFYPDAVAIEFVAGVPDQRSVPQLYCICLSLLVGSWFTDPTDEGQRDKYKTSYHNLLMKLQQEKEV